MASKNKNKSKVEQKKETPTSTPKVRAGNVTIVTPKQEFIKEKIELLQKCSNNISNIISAVQSLQKTSKVEMQGNYEVQGNITIGAEETNLKDSTFVFTGDGDQTISSDSDFHNVTIDKSGGTATIKSTMLRVLKDLSFLAQNME